MHRGVLEPSFKYLHPKFGRCLKMQARRQVAAIAILVAIISLALGASIVYGLSSSAKTITVTSTLTPPAISHYSTATVTSYSISNRTVTLMQLTTLPPNEVVTKVIIFETYVLYPVVYLTNCGTQYGGSLSFVSTTLTSYIATTTASEGTTITIYDHETTNGFYSYTNNNLAITTYTTVMSNSTVTTIVRETIS